MVEFTHTTIQEFKERDLAHRKANKEKNGSPMGVEFYELGLHAPQSKFSAMRSAKRNELINNRDIKEVVPPFTMVLRTGFEGSAVVNNVFTFPPEDDQRPVTLEVVQQTVNKSIDCSASVEMLRFDPKDPDSFPYDIVPYLIGHHQLNIRLSGPQGISGRLPWQEALVCSPIVLSGTFVEHVVLNFKEGDNQTNMDAVREILRLMAPVNLKIICALRQMEPDFSPILCDIVHVSACDRVQLLFVDIVCGSKKRSLVPFLSLMHKQYPSSRSDIIAEIHSNMDQASYDICREINKDARTGLFVQLNSYARF